MSHILDRLYEVIERRAAERPAGSYVVTLLDGGRDAAAAKVLEEADELVRAERDDETVHEAADLLFHTLVLLAVEGVPASRVWAELERRFGVSGLEEKASRGGDAGR